ncbi:MAG: glutamyl-tRNA reductase [Planctomycetales bacterium]|nr:glutamyl-tRNA reductase [Planctomycetales bacterium]
MQIILIGINHKTAPVAIRQRLACDAARVSDALTRLRAAYPGSEFFLLSTCNRVECCAVVDRAAGPKPAELAKWLADFRAVEFSQIEQYLYIKTDEDAVTHLFTVAASLDSMVIGESQITAQVKESYKMACTCQTTGKVLNRLFHDAFRATKEIVTRTSISNRRVSVAGVAVELAKQLFSDLQSAKVVIVGAGQMGNLLVEHFRHEKCGDITVVNRSRQRSCRIAEEHGVADTSWDRLDQEIAEANIVVGAASAPQGYLFSKDRIKLLMRRRHRILLIIDITVPRSFDPAVGEIENVYLYSIDDLAQVAQDNIKLREGDMELAVGIIYEAVSAFMDWFQTRQVGPVVGQIKDAFEKISEMEMERFFVGPRQEAHCRGQMEASIGRVVNKLCHCVIKNIDTLSRERSPGEAERFAQHILDNAQQIISEDQKKNQ